MYKLITLIAFSIFAPSLFGQQVQSHYLDKMKYPDQLDDYDFDLLYNSIKSNPNQEKDLTDFVYLLDSSLFSRLNNNLEWEISRRNRTLEFDEYGNILNSLDERYNEDQQEWINENNYSYSFHNSVQENEYVKYAWNTVTQTWSDTVSYANHDIDGKILSLIFKIWSYNIDRFVFGKRYIPTSYTADGEISVETIDNWNTEDQSWNRSGERQYTYDGNNLLERLQLQWDENNQIFENYELRSYSYDGEGNQLSELYQRYDDDGQMVNYRLYTHSYNNDGLEILQLRQDWDSSINNWRNRQKNERIYNFYGQLSRSTYVDWQTFWRDDYRYLYQYDDNNNITELLYEDFNEIAFGWEEDSKTNYFYSIHDVVGVNDIQNEYFRVFPNPSSDQLSVEATDVSIDKLNINVYNASGQLVIKNYTLTNNKLNINALSPGVYFLNIRTEKKVIVKKFIKN